MAKKKAAPAPKTENDHQAKPISVKTALVDEMMIPLIEWLNSYESIHTTYCCQGEPWDSEKSEEDNKFYAPYVSFICTNQLELILVLSIIRYAAEVHVLFNLEKGQLEYVARFNSQQSLMDTINYLKKNEEVVTRRKVHGW